MRLILPLKAFQKAAEFFGGKAALKQDDLAAVIRDMIKGIVILVGHAQQVGKAVGRVLRAVAVFFVDDYLIYICIQMQFRTIQTVIGGSAGKQITDDGIVCFLPVMRRRIPGAGIGIQLIPYLRDDLEKLIFVDGLGEIGEYAVAYGGSGVIEIRVTA